jgi:hypothetical protein
LIQATPSLGITFPASRAFRTASALVIVGGEVLDSAGEVREVRVLVVLVFFGMMRFSFAG